MEMLMPSPNNLACQMIAGTDWLEEKEPSNQVPLSSRRVTQQLAPLWSIADLQQGQLHRSSSEMAKEHPVQAFKVGCCSDATKLYWAQWASLCHQLHDTVTSGHLEFLKPCSE